jgi:hypothetical protein
MEQTNIASYCKEPSLCPIFSTCKKKFKPHKILHGAANYEGCTSRPVPCVSLRFREDDSIGGYLSKMAREEHMLRVGAGERVD